MNVPSKQVHFLDRDPVCHPDCNTDFDPDNLGRCKQGIGLKFLTKMSLRLEHIIEPMKQYCSKLCEKRINLPP